MEKLCLEHNEGLPPLESCDRPKLKIAVTKVNEAVKDIRTKNITELNSLLYVAAYVVTEKVGMMKEKKPSEIEGAFLVKED